VLGTDGHGSYSRIVPHEQQPILALDVDGVISLFGFEGPVGEAPGRFHLIDGIAHCIPEGLDEHLERLAGEYEIVWATGWEERANELLLTILGLEDELPYLTFDGNARFGTAHWKIDAIDDYAAGRPLAWIDDCIDESCRSWAAERDEPTLLLHTRSDEGLTPDHVETLIGWARERFPPRG
jgi:hypothetical protein